MSLDAKYIVCPTGCLPQEHEAFYAQIVKEKFRVID